MWCVCVCVSEIIDLLTSALNVNGLIKNRIPVIRECMGCQLAKENSLSIENDNQSNAKKNSVHTMPSNKDPSASIDYKSRLEWKLCMVCDYMWQAISV